MERLFPQFVKPFEFCKYSGTADGSAPLATRAVPYKASNSLSYGRDQGSRR
jgi:hypothetical protein